MVTMNQRNNLLRNYLRRGYRALIPLVYAHTKYKLFTQRTFADLDDTMCSLVCATDVLSDFVKPITIKAPFADSMLVVAPHQDDEIIGCGGAMLLQLAAGKDVSVVFVLDGGSEHIELGYAREKLVRIREEEASQVAKEMQITPPRFLRHPKLHEENLSKIAKQLRAEIIRSNADSIFVPFFLDSDLDHRLTNYALAEALVGIPKDKKVYGYEVWGLCVSNVILIIDSVIKLKQKLLSFYTSQLAGIDYVNCVTGLNMYHSKTLGAGVCKYAEKFFEIPAEDYVGVVKKLRRTRKSSSVMTF